MDGLELLRSQAIFVNGRANEMERTVRIKRNRWLIPIALMVSWTWAGVAFAQVSEQLDRWTIGDWTGASITDNGYFERCVAAVGFENGSTLSVSIDYNGDLQIRFTDENWNLARDSTYDIDLFIDNSAALPVREAIAIRSNQVLVNAHRDYGLLRRLRSGTALRVQSNIPGLDGVILPLQGLFGGAQKNVAMFSWICARCQFSILHCDGSKAYSAGNECQVPV